MSDLLTNIVGPSSYIREGYITHLITTVDGRTIVGTIKSRSGPLIKIKPFSGDPINISTSQIKEIQEQKTSIMPERLIEGMTDQQVKDLHSYLMKSNNK